MELTPASELVKQEGHVVIRIEKSTANKLKQQGGSYNQAIKDLLSGREQVIIKYELNHRKILEELEQIRLMITAAIGR